MLRFRAMLHFCKPKGTSKPMVSDMPGFKPISVHSEEEVLTDVPRKVFQSKSVRQRRRRNVMKRIYGSAYDHDMDDYR